MNQRFTNAGEGVKEVQSHYDSWSLKLSEICIQACYATIAALFAVFGTSGKLLSSGFAIASLVVVFLVLGANILVRKLIVWKLHSRVTYAEDKVDEWNKEFDAYVKSGGQWPYTDGIDNLGKLLRHINVWGVLLAANLLIISVLTASRNDNEGKNTTAVSTNAIPSTLQSTQAVDLNPILEELRKINAGISNSAELFQTSTKVPAAPTDFSPLAKEFENIRMAISNSTPKYVDDTSKSQADYMALTNELRIIETSILNSYALIELGQKTTNQSKLQIRDTGLFFHLGRSVVELK